MSERRRDAPNGNLRPSRAREQMLALLREWHNVFEGRTLTHSAAGAGTGAGTGAAGPCPLCHKYGRCRAAVGVETGGRTTCYSR